MKKALCIAAAMLCAVMSAPVTASAVEAGTYEELRAKTGEQEAEFPDPEARYEQITENGIHYRIYDSFALLEECLTPSITAVDIPETVEEKPVVGCIGDPFRYCRGLVVIRLPDSFTHFRWDHLVNTMTVELGSIEEPQPSVEQVLVSETNPHFRVADGILYSADMKTLIGCPPSLGIRDLHIPAETDTIGDYAFFANMTLAEAVIPENIQHINCNAFTACLNLRYAELPENITTVSGDMFYYCENLEEVVFRGEIRTIGYGAFNCCKSLKEFTIPETVTQIGWKAFDETGCTENADGLHYVQDWLVGTDSDPDTVSIRRGTKGIAELSMSNAGSTKLVTVPASVRQFGMMSVSPLPAIAQYALHFRAAVLPVRVISNAWGASDVYICDPDCAIADSEKTIPAAYKYLSDEPVTVVIPDTTGQPDRYITGDTVIHGYAGSTAQAYAEKYGRKFAVITPDGDIDCDGALNTADIVLMQKYLLTVPDAVPEAWKAGDLNGDNILNAADLSLMKQTILRSAVAKAE